MSACHDCPGCSAAPRPVLKPQQPPHVIAIVGPPNSGKSTLFNRLTGLRQKVANFPGVTVEHRVGRARVQHERDVVLVDLPGVYSLLPRSEDEKVTYDILTGQRAGMEPEAVLLILDCTNLGRHLLLAAPVLNLKLPTLVILNMADDLRSRGGEVDPAALSAELGAPVALISASTGEGIDKVYQFIAGTAAGHSTVKTPLVELPVLKDIPVCRRWASEVGAGAAYRAPAPPLWTRRLDAVFLHPLAGPLVFLAVVVLVFQSIFAWATPVMDGMKYLIQTSGAWIGLHLTNPLLRSLVVDGIWSGVGSVLVFLPQILLLFLFIGILEDSGYLARGALIADRTMRRFGLQGKSFIPLLSAYACAVPAVMSARTIENKRDRMATIFIAPLMTCSARLPVYTLVIAAFLPDRPLLGPFLGMQAAAMLGLYALGFVTAVFTAKLLKSSIMKSEGTPFLLEMPPYRWPTLQSLGLRLVDRSRVFLRRAGTVILAVALLLWMAAHLPLVDGHAPEIAQSLAGRVGHFIEPAIKPLGFNWKIGIGLLTSLAARETIVSTLGAIYGMDGEARSQGLQQALRADLTPAGAVALLIFFAFALQCMSTLAVVRRETGGWKWPAAQFAYMGLLAYAGAFAANQLASGGIARLVAFLH